MNKENLFNYLCNICILIRDSIKTTYLSFDKVKPDYKSDPESCVRLVLIIRYILNNLCKDSKILSARLGIIWDLFPTWQQACLKKGSRYNLFYEQHCKNNYVTGLIQVFTKEENILKDNINTTSLSTTSLSTKTPLLPASIAEIKNNNHSLSEVGEFICATNLRKDNASPARQRKIVTVKMNPVAERIINTYFSKNDKLRDIILEIINKSPLSNNEIKEYIEEIISFLPLKEIASLFNKTESQIIEIKNIPSVFKQDENITIEVSGHKHIQQNKEVWASRTETLCKEFLKKESNKLIRDSNKLNCYVEEINKNEELSEQEKIKFIWLLHGLIKTDDICKRLKLRKSRLLEIRKWLDLPPLPKGRGAYSFNIIKDSFKKSEEAIMQSPELPNTEKSKRSIQDQISYQLQNRNDSPKKEPILYPTLIDNPLDIFNKPMNEKASLKDLCDFYLPFLKKVNNDFIPEKLITEIKEKKSIDLKDKIKYIYLLHGNVSVMKILSLLEISQAQYYNIRNLLDLPSLRGIKTTSNCESGKNNQSITIPNIAIENESVHSASLDSENNLLVILKFRYGSESHKKYLPLINEKWKNN